MAQKTYELVAVEVEIDGFKLITQEQERLIHSLPYSEFVELTLN